MPPRRAEWREALPLIAGALALRGWFLAETLHDPDFRALAIDARFYHDMGVRFAHGDFLFGPGPLWFAPLYPFLVGMVYAIAGPTPGIVIALQFALGVVTAAVGWRIAARFSRGAGRVAGAMLALTPVFPVYENQLLYTALALALTATYLNLQIRARETGVSRDAFLAGGGLGLLSLVSSSALLFAPFGAWRLGAARRRARMVAFAAGLAIPLLPVLVRNGVVGGEWTPITANGGMLLATGFAADARGGRALLRTPSDFGPSGAYQREAEAAVGHPLSLGDASRWHQDRAVAHIRADPGWAAGLVGRKLLLLVNAREIDDNLGLSAYADRARSLRVVPAPWAWFLIGGLAGAALAFRRRDAAAEHARTLALFAGVYAASLLPFFVTARYRLPLCVPLAALAGFAFREVAAAARSGKRGEIVLPVAVALACVPLLARDPGLREDPAVARNAEGAAALGQGRVADALRLLDAAVAADPSLAGAHANRALALRALGRVDEALSAADEAIRRDASLAPAWQTRGALLAEAGRMEEAAASFRRAAELRPDDPIAWGNLARALAAAGHPGDALEAGRKAVALGAGGIRELLPEWERAAAGTP